MPFQAMAAALALLAPATPPPCAGVAASISAQRLNALAAPVAKQLHVARVDVLGSLGYGVWSILTVDSHVADQAYLFYAGDPATQSYVTLWSGAGRSDEEASIRSWVLAHAPGIPAPLAACFSYRVTHGNVAPEPAHPKPSPSTAVDFANFDYAAIPCASNVPPPARIRAGTYSYEDPKMGADFTVKLESVVRGSLRAGTQQAVAVIACDFPMGGTAGAYAYDIRGPKAVLLGEVGDTSWGGDWGAGPDSIHLRFADGFLYADTCSGGGCATRETRTYALRNGKFVKVWAQTREVDSP
jgi:hypothetical protein